MFLDGSRKSLFPGSICGETVRQAKINIKFGAYGYL
jgi:hypothetical protein